MENDLFLGGERALSMLVIQQAVVLMDYSTFIRSDYFASKIGTFIKC